MRADNTRHIVAAAQHRHEYTRAKAVQALRALETAGTPVTFDAIASAAGVSRSWLYTQPDLRAEIERLRAASQRASGIPLPIRQRASDASLLRRLEAANERTRQLAEENHRLRDQLARALGEQRMARTREADKPASRRLGSATIGPC
jgi:negative regulator of sigma E activity